MGRRQKPVRDERRNSHPVCIRIRIYTANAFINSKPGITATFATLTRAGTRTWPQGGGGGGGGNGGDGDDGCPVRWGG